VKTYRELLDRRAEFDLCSPEWNELTGLIDAYVRAQIIAGHMEFASMLVCDFCDLIEDGSYATDPEFKEECDKYIAWFRKWNMGRYADELTEAIEQTRGR